MKVASNSALLILANLDDLSFKFLRMFQECDPSRGHIALRAEQRSNHGDRHAGNHVTGDFPDRGVSAKIGVGADPIGHQRCDAGERSCEKPFSTAAEPGSSENRGGVEGQKSYLVSGRGINCADGEDGNDHLGKNRRARLACEAFSPVHLEKATRDRAEKASRL